MHPLYYENFVAYSMNDKTWVFGFCNDSPINPKKIESKMKKQFLDYSLSIPEKDLRKSLADISKEKLMDSKMPLYFNQENDELIDNFQGYCLMNLFNEETKNQRIFLTEPKSIDLKLNSNGSELIDLTDTLNGSVKTHYMLMVQQIRIINSVN